MSGVVDSSIYPVLAYDIVSKFTTLPDDRFVAWLIKGGFATLLTLIALAGVSEVGRGLIMLSIFVMVPYMMTALLAIPKMDTTHWSEVRGVNNTYFRLGESTAYYANGQPAPGSAEMAVNWPLLLNTLYWNFSGFQRVSTVAGEVHNPRKTFPRGMALAVMFVMVSYLFPLGVVSAVNKPHWLTWKDGSFSEIAKQSVGRWMGGWIAAASIFGATGMFLSEMVADSFQLLGMAHMGLAPRALAYRTSRGQPVLAMLASWVIVMVLVAFDFNAILVVSNFMSSLGASLVMMSAIVLLPKYGPPSHVNGCVCMHARGARGLLASLLTCARAIRTAPGSVATTRGASAASCCSPRSLRCTLRWPCTWRA